MRKFGKKNIDSHIVINHEVDDIRDKYLDENFVMFDKQTNSKLLSQNYTNDTIKSSQFNENFENLKSKNKQNEEVNPDKNKKRKIFRLSELEKNNLYYTLNLKENATQDQIKSSYKLLIRLNHPDKGGEPEKFQQIQRAYTILKNEYCRRIYDKFSYKSFGLIEHILNNEIVDIKKIEGNCFYKCIYYIEHFE